MLAFGPYMMFYMFAFSRPDDPCRRLANLKIDKLLVFRGFQVFVSMSGSVWGCSTQEYGNRP